MLATDQFISLGADIQDRDHPSPTGNTEAVTSVCVRVVSNLNLLTSVWRFSFWSSRGHVCGSCERLRLLVDECKQEISLQNVWSYMTTVACLSSPALQRISAAAFTRHFFLALLEGLNFLRTKSQLSEKHANTTKQRSILSKGCNAAIDVKWCLWKASERLRQGNGRGEPNRPEQDWQITHWRPVSAPWGHSNRSIFSTKAWTDARTPHGPP